MKSQKMSKHDAEGSKSYPVIMEYKTEMQTTQAWVRQKQEIIRIL